MSDGSPPGSPDRLAGMVEAPAIVVAPDTHEVVAVNEEAASLLTPDRSSVVDERIESLVAVARGDDGIGAAVDRAVADDVELTVLLSVSTQVGDRQVEATLTPIRVDGRQWVTVACDPSDSHTERRLWSLAESMRDLLDADTREEVASLATTVLATAVDDVAAGYWTYDGSDDALRPLTANDAVQRIADRPVDGLVFRDGSLPMAAFDDGRRRSLGNEARAREFPLDATDLTVEPVGDHGVLVVGATGGQLTPVERDVVTLVAESVAATLDRIDRERELSLLNEVVDRSAIGLSIIDPTEPGNPIVYCNEYFVELTGYDESELLGRSPALLRGPETDSEREAEIQAAIEEGVPVSRELLNYRSDGSRFWNQVDIVPITDESGECTHVLRFQRDVTDRVRRRQQSTVLNRVLRHNLRNDLGVVLGYAEQLAYELDLDPGNEEYLDVIVRKAEDLVDLADKVRNGLEDIEDGEVSQVRLGSLLTDIAVEFRTQYPDADVGLSLGGGQDCYVDRTLGIALREAVENGIEHHDGPTPTVRLATEIAWDDHVRVRVTDDGPGLPEMERTVFDREADETPLAHGSGIGLWLVTWTVTTLGGRVAVDDADAGGTEVTFEVPTTGSSAGVRSSTVSTGDGDVNDSS